MSEYCILIYIDKSIRSLYAAFSANTFVNGVLCNIIITNCLNYLDVKISLTVLDYFSLFDILWRKSVEFGAWKAVDALILMNLLKFTNYEKVY